MVFPVGRPLDLAIVAGEDGSILVDSFAGFARPATGACFGETLLQILLKKKRRPKGDHFLPALIVLGNRWEEVEVKEVRLVQLFLDLLCLLNYFSCCRHLYLLNYQGRLK